MQCVKYVLKFKQFQRIRNTSDFYLLKGVAVERGEGDSGKEHWKFHVTQCCMLYTPAASLEMKWRLVKHGQQLRHSTGTM